MGKKLVLRDQFSQIRSHVNESEITVITGPRQVGKTTLIRQIMEDIGGGKTPPANINYFNLDVSQDHQLFLRQENVVSFIKNRIPKKGKLYVFIDEIQRIPNPGIFLKGIYDLSLPVKMVVTGSSSLEIRSKIAESLTGRKRLFTMYPLSLKEYVSYFDANLYALAVKGDAHAQASMSHYVDDFLLYGGYPKVLFESGGSERILPLEEIFTSYIDKDIVGLLRVRDPYVFTKFVQILSEETGNPVNIKGMSEELHIKDDTIRKYITSLEQTFIIRRVPPFFGSTRTEIRKMPKVYFFDNGIRNYAKDGKDMSENAYRNRKDAGFLLENFIFSELVKAGMDDIRYWRTKYGAEVDFIVHKKGMDIPIEIKATSSHKPDVSRGFYSHLTTYTPKYAVIVSFSKHDTVKVHGTEVHYLQPYQLIQFLIQL